MRPSVRNLLGLLTKTTIGRMRKIEYIVNPMTEIILSFTHAVNRSISVTRAAEN